MSLNKISKLATDSATQAQLEKQISNELEKIVRLLGLIDGTITIRARGGELCRHIEIVNLIDVLTLD